ncbi:DUF5686 and carboxypeptidase-like regulatory domain-containing protein [Lewinella cohaerens]|uniref:DUF5686 and carboxypeptidase-like regulatory domain-containing protein n=1 Tax=Lewinella cohaerens TaxID=70995 RepID=UPI00146C61A9|nr:DUF5686 and carboxypeptidase-like regulatory domain-containing protein [Lewinella cohaerens]
MKTIKTQLPLTDARLNKFITIGAIFLFFFGGLHQIHAQYLFSGRVIDADTKEGIPFCNVYYAGTTMGVSTDVDGYYELPVTVLHDSLTASAIGYTSLAKTTGDQEEQTINFSLESANTTLDEIVVIAGENPANAIVKGIIQNKDLNNLEQQPAYQYENYTKVELDFEKVPERLRESKLMDPFDFVFENIDSTSDEKPFLPIYINEALSDVYYSEEIGRSAERIKAQRASGTDNQSFIEFVKKVYTPFNVYNNYIDIIDKRFISPFSDAGLGFYEYYILDSAFVSGQWSYKLKFKPRRKQENTFYGDFWVADSTFAIQRLNMRMSPEVNINLVKRIIIYQEYEPHENLWLPVKQKMIVDFTLTEKSPGMIARRTKSSRDYRLNPSEIQNNFPEKKKGTSPPPPLNSDEEYWQSIRHEPLSETESTIYALVDSIQNVPAFKTYGEIFATVFGGNFDLGKFSVGPYYSIYSKNPIEGTRLRLGLRSDDDLSENLRIKGYAAYGFLDERWKYGLEGMWLIHRYPWTIIGAAHRKDISLSSENSEDFQEGNLFSYSFRRDVYLKLIDVSETKVFYERHWDNGLSNRVTILNRQMDPYGNNEEGGFNYAFVKPGGESVDTTLNTTEVILKFRYAPGETFLGERFNRVSLGTTKPILEAQYTLGLEDFFGSQYNYHKFSLGLRHWFNISPIGWFSYRIKAGKTFGTLPFLLQEVHPGNEAVFMSRSVFNTMNNYEFVSDTYASVFLEHHFDGFFFNHIPLLRKLKLREVASFKAVVGSMSKNNQKANRLNGFQPQSGADLYTGFRSPSTKPYLEAGIGIENILKVIRVDALWRLSYLDNPEASRFSITVGAYLGF